MLASSNLPAPSLVPLMRYRDVSAAIDWLCTALGFEKQVAVSDPDGGVYYAQLTYGNSLVMIGSVRDTELDKLMRQPDEVGGIETQSCYLVVEDADAHYARATAAGAEIVLDIKSDGLGRRGYSCKDPEGHIWNFGTYNPWKGPSLPATLPPPRKPNARRSAVAAVLAVLVAVALGAAWWITGADLPHLAKLTPPAPQQASRTASDTKALPDEALRESLASMRAAKEQAEFAAEAARKDLTDAQAARTAAETAGQSARADMESERAAKESALRSIQELEAKLAVERNAKDSAGRAATDAKLELEKERMAKEALERAVREQKTRKSQSQSQSSLELPPSTAAPPQGAQIETSATRPATAEATKPPQPTWTVAAEHGPTSAKVEAETKKLATSTRARPRAMRKRVAQTPVRHFKPTYITDLHEVPWPYNVWYLKKN
jgi:uncharacterized glyoxalase superfamily protein PhnB